MHLSFMSSGNPKQLYNKYNCASLAKEWNTKQNWCAGWVISVICSSSTERIHCKIDVVYWFIVVLLRFVSFFTEEFVVSWSVFLNFWMPCLCRVSHQLLVQMAVASQMSSTQCSLCLAIEQTRFGQRKSASSFTQAPITRTLTVALSVYTFRRLSTLA